MRHWRVEPLESRDMLAIGSLDPSFNGDGKATFLFQSTFSANATAVAVQNDGKIVVAGQSNSSANGWGFAIARMNANGSLDTTFGGDGRTEVGFNLGATGFKNDYAHDVAIQADGKIVVVVGYAEKNSNDNDVAITRLNVDGSLDTTFGSSGRKTVDFRGGLDGASSVAIQSDGKIVVGGIARFSPSAYQGFVMRLTTSGALDTTFGGGNDGYQAISFHDENGLGLDGVTDIAIQTNGKIVAVGSSYSADGDYDIGIARLNSNGTSDTTFGDDENLGGINPDGENTLAIDFGAKEDDQATSVKIAADGKIYVAGYFHVGLGLTDLDENFLLARFTTTGLLDTSFASGQGYANTSFDLGTADEDFSDRANDLIIQPDGKLLLVGEAHGDGSHSRFAVARFNTTGIIDTTFSGDGKITTSFGSGFAAGQAAVIQPNGAVVIAGKYDSSFALTRVLTATPVVSLAATSSSISEQAGTATIRATMSTPASETVTVHLSFGGTSTNSTDYSRSGTAITIAAGQTSGSVTVTAIGDAFIEGTETVTVGIASVTNGTENGTQSVTVSIRDVLKPALSNANDVVTLTFTSANAFTLTINGASQSYSIATVSEIIIDGLGGNDMFSSSTPFANDTTTLRQNLVQSTSDTYRFSVLNTETVYLFGSSGDSATFTDTAGDDLFWALPGYSIMAGPGYNYINEVIGFGPSITATATTGFDVAQLIGSSNAEAYVGGVSSSSLTGPSVTFVAQGFDQNYGYSGGGTDTAVLNGSAGDDVMYGFNAYSILVAANVLQYVVGIPDVTANAGIGAIDIAILYDSQGDDSFVANPTTARLWGVGYSNRANGFDQVHANTYGGYDVATLDGSTGNDVYYGYNASAQLYASGVYYVQTHRFELTHVNLGSGSGNDLAFLYDGLLNDQLTAASNQVELLYSNGARNRLNAFDTVYAYSQNGGTNRKTVTNPLAFGLVLNGTWA